uniref:Uncharacterized protein n=1 Tax=Glossina pallidipes TaxID=7398 RepID=A0A1B0AFG6_GLOPL
MFKFDPRTTKRIRRWLMQSQFGCQLGGGCSYASYLELRYQRSNRICISKPSTKPNNSQVDKKAHDAHLTRCPLMKTMIKSEKLNQWLKLLRMFLRFASRFASNEEE